MKRYIVSTWMNVGDGTMWEFRPGRDYLERGPRVRVEADSVDEALEKVWVVGNRMGPDADGNSWPSECRSMCMGDVVFIGAIGSGLAEFWSCEAFGWKPVDGDKDIFGGEVSSRHPGLSAWRDGKVLA